MNIGILNLTLIDFKVLKDSIFNDSYEGLLYIPKTSNSKALENKNPIHFKQ